MKNIILEGIIKDGTFPNRNTVTCQEKDYKIKGGIIGSEVRFKPSRRKKGKLIETIKKSSWENIKPCPHTDCGGCTYDGFSYDKEIEYKEKLLNNLLHEELNLDNVKIYSAGIFENYRNKMEFTFGDTYKGSPLALGLHKKNRFYEIENTNNCRIAHEDFNIIREKTRDFFKDKAFFNRRSHEGTLRHLAIRRTNYGEILVNIVTTKDNDLDLKSYVDELLYLKLEAQIKGICHTINDSQGDAIIKEDFHILYGRDYVIEELLGLKFKIGTFSFFQTNTYSAAYLYQLAFDMIDNLQGKKVLDLYCGTGTISQVFAKKAESVLGVEIVEEAVNAARENAKYNNISNVDFIAGDVAKVVNDLDIKADIIILDPPRVGINNPKALEKIIDFSPEEFLYISCNPISYVKDVKRFIERGYKLKKIVGLDQFPRTVNLELISLLEKD